MLKLKNVCKCYKVGEEKKIILDNINLDFKNRELVFILGASGSGKSTLLNIIGGNLNCDSGEIWLDGECISDYNDHEYDKYRSLVIGNIFQDYNLIDYLNVTENVLLGYSDGLSKKEIALLFKQLGIYDKRYDKVVNLSGGEKQRVAIARALVNNPDIVLADEPTGALDSKNGIEVMEILSKIALNKLVIVVSHDNYLANKYASRIINIKDGKCDFAPLNENSFIVTDGRKNKSKLYSVIKLAIKNLLIKKMRTIFTAIAISLGVISMSLVVNLYSNFSSEISNLEKDVVSVFPIVINNGDYQILDAEKEKVSNKIVIKDRDKYIHTNKINKDYLDYVNNIDKIKYITNDYDISLPLISDTYNKIDNKYLKIIPSEDYISDNYEILAGRNVKNKNEILLKLDNYNNADSKLINNFNINSDIDYDDIIGRRIKVIINDDYYIKNGKYYIINNNNRELYNKSNISLEIVGVIKEKNETDNNNYLYCSQELINEIININSDSMIVKDQIISQNNILGNDIDRDILLSYLGYETLPSQINIYVDNLNDKDKVTKLLDDYNLDNDKMVYVDTMASAIDIVKKFIAIISVVLILFSVVAIIISSLMIGILTNVRVLERKKEIGIFRSLGASKLDIKTLFNIENIFIGIISLFISIFVIMIMVGPINKMMNNYMGLEDIFFIKYWLILIVFIINLVIIKISGSIPAIKASRMEIVNCIYNR